MMFFKVPRTISIVLIILILIITSLALYSISSETQTTLKGEIQNRLNSVANVMASQIDGDTFVQVQAGEEETARFIGIRDQLWQAKQADPNLRDIYTLRQNHDVIEIVVDGNYGFGSDSRQIGAYYGAPSGHLLSAFLPGAYTGKPDEAWGTELSGYAPIKNSAGTIVGVIGVDMDRTLVQAELNRINLIILFIGLIAMIAVTFGSLLIESRRAAYDDKIVESEKKYKALVELLPQTIVELDLAGQITSTNRIAHETFGFTDEEFLKGINIRQLLVPEDRERVERANHAILAGKRCGGVEYTAQRKDGSTFPVIIFLDVLIRDKNTAGLRGVLIDITDRKRIEAELERRVRERTLQLADTVKKLETEVQERTRAEEQIILANRKLALMNDVTFQDIQNKVTVLRGYVGLIKTTTDEHDRLPFVVKVEDVLATIHHLIKNTKEYQQMRVDQSRWIHVEKEIRIEAARISQMQNVALDIDLHGLRCLCDPLIHRVFYIFLDNAILHGKRVTRISFYCQKKDSNVLLICEDNGVGIPVQQKPTIFDRVVAGEGKFELFFVREFLGIFGMTITENGEPEKGARFEITIPSGAYRFGKNDTVHNNG